MRTVLCSLSAESFVLLFLHLKLSPHSAHDEVDETWKFLMYAVNFILVRKVGGV